MTNIHLTGAAVSVLLQAVSPLPASKAAPTPSTPSAPSSTPASAPPSFAGAAPSTAALIASVEAPNRPVLELDAAERSAMEHQPTIRQARFATAAAVGRIQQARAGYLPQVTGTASWLYGNESSKGASGAATSQSSASGSASTTGSSYSAQLAASQLIYDFGVTREKWKAADRSVEALQAAELTARNQIVYNVRSAFFTARADRALVLVQAETLANLQKHLVQTEGFVQAGTQPEISLAQAKTDVANAKVSLIAAQNNYDIARAQLNLAMGVTTSVDYDVADRGLDALDGEGDSGDQLVAKALAARPELANLTKQHEADVLTIRSIEGGYGPSVSGLAGVGAFGSDISSLTPAWQIGLSLTWPILAGGLTHGQVHEAEGNLGVVDAQLEAERLQVRLDVEQARLSIRSAKVSIGATEEALVNAREQLRLAEGRFSQGVGSIIELGDAQVAVTAAGAQRVQADFNLSIARAQLLLALGRP